MNSTFCTIFLHNLNYLYYSKGVEEERNTKNFDMILNNLLNLTTEGRFLARLFLDDVLVRFSIKKEKHCKERILHGYALSHTGAMVATGDNAKFFTSQRRRQMELLTMLFIVKTGVAAVILLGLWVVNRSSNQAS